MKLQSMSTQLLNLLLEMVRVDANGKPIHQGLLKLLYSNDTSPYKADEVTSDIANEMINPTSPNIKIYPYPFDLDATTTDGSFIRMYYNSGAFNENEVILESKIVIDVVVARSLWLINSDDGKISQGDVKSLIRPYEIMGQIIDTLGRDSFNFLTIDMTFSNFQHLYVNDKFDCIRLYANYMSVETWWLMIDYKDLKEIDLKLHLQSGSEIKLDNLVIKPYSLREIKDVGYTNYISNLQMISISMDDFITSVTDEEHRKMLESERTNLKTLDFYVTLGGVEILVGLFQALSMIFRTDDVRMLEDGVIALNFVKIGVIELDEQGNSSVNEERLVSLKEEDMTLIHRDNFDDFVRIVQLQNYLTKDFEEDEEEELAIDEETKKLMEQMKKHRKKVEEKKKAQRQADGDDGDIDISDIISAVSSKSNSINKLNVWDFTLYQLYDEYSRLELIDNYHFSLKAIMAGAEKVDLKHWSSKL